MSKIGPNPALLNTLHPRERWFLNTLLHIPDRKMDDLVNYDKRLPLWDDAAQPLVDIVERLECAGWVTIDEDKIIPTDQGLSLRTEVAHAYDTLDRPEWRRRLQATVGKRVQLPGEHPLHQALAALDRRACIADSLQPLAELDSPLTLIPGMTESALHAVTMTLMAVEPRSGERVLICGAKGGYLAFLTQWLVGEHGTVVALDWQQAIVDHIRKAAEKVGDVGKRLEVSRQDDVTLGLAARAPWHAIIVNGAIPRVPYNLMHQLDDADGRILFFLHDGHETSECWLVRKNEAVLKEERLSNFRYTPIPGRNGFDTIRNLQAQYESARKTADATASAITPIQTQTPYPLARAFFSAFNALEAHERHGRALKVSEAFTKYLSILTIASCTALDEKSTKIAGELRKLSGKPSYGQWFAAMRELLPIAREHPVGKLVGQEFDRSWKHKVVLEAYQKLQQETGQPQAGLQKSVKLRDFLEKIVEYRNKSGEGHGNVSSEGSARTISDQLLQAFAVIMAEAPLFSTYQLGAILKNERHLRKVIISFMKLQGANNLSQRWELGVEEGRDWVPGVVLFSEKERRIVLSLHPWMVWEEGSNRTPELFLFNSRKNDKFDYMTYHNQDVYPDPALYEAFLELFERFPEPKAPAVDPDQARLMLSMLLVPIVSDGKVTADEMYTLRTAVLQFGLAADETAADDWIRELISREHPGVWFEE